MTERIDLLRKLVDAADMEAARGEYAARNNMAIDGEISCSEIRQIFGWEQTPAAGILREALFGV